MVVIVRGTTEELTGFEIALASMTKILTKAKVLDRAPDQSAAPAATVDASNGSASPAGGEA
jgi:hypothetical protein